MMIQCHHQCLLNMDWVLLTVSAYVDNSNGLISSNYTDSDTTEDPILFSQKHLNDLIRDLCLFREKAELFASRLKKQNMVEKYVKIGYYRKCNRDLSSTFKVKWPICYCYDIEELFQTLGVIHIVNEWRLFIDSSKRSLRQFFCLLEIKNLPSLLHTLPN